MHALPKVALPLTKLTLLAQRNAVVIRATQKHECLLTVIDAFETSTLFHIVTEHTAGPPLCDIEADVSTARDIIRDVLSGLAYLHEKGMIHGAVVSENVLLSKVSFPCRAKLVTFGCASGKSEMGACGRDDDAPEVICFHRRGAASDIFSTGVLLHRLLVGREPFSGSGDEYLGAVSKGISSEGLGGAARILREMLADQESVRPSAQDCLEDAWFAAPLLNEKKDGEDKPGTLARRGSDPKTVIMDFEGGLAKRRSVSFAEEGAHGSPACPASPASPASLVSLPSVKSPRSSLS